MIDINSSDFGCTGCGACAQKCPRHCISLVQDREGFLYPKVNEENCVECGLCEDVCPVLNCSESSEVKRTFFAKHTDEDVRNTSSSGGIFTWLAERVLNEKGVVFGVKWNDKWQVEHTYVETLEELSALRTSKYVQSVIGTAYIDAEHFLKGGRKVLFSGTPCQIAGLKSFLRLDYDNLLCVECVCHGVPSPGLWKKYIDEVSMGRNIVGINHRDKTTGLKNYRVVLDFEDGTGISQHHDANPWTRAFIRNLDLRPSCYKCHFKCASSCADIALGDLWGAETILQNKNDDKGMSLVIVHTEKGLRYVDNIQIVAGCALSDIVKHNSAIETSPYCNGKRSLFFEDIVKGKSFVKTVEKFTRDSFVTVFKRKVHKFVSTFKEDK